MYMHTQLKRYGLRKLPPPTNEKNVIQKNGGISYFPIPEKYILLYKIVCFFV